MSEKIRKTYTSTEMIDVLEVLNSKLNWKQMTANSIVKELHTAGYRIVKMPK